MLGFVILRHVSKQEHDLLWNECYRCIRRWYPEEPIMIVDDNSRKDLVSSPSLSNTIIVESEYHGTGEVLPYYYLHRLKPFKRAIVLHDSMFIQKKLDITDSGTMMLWHFEDHQWDQTDVEVEMLLRLNHRKKLLDIYCQKDKWMGCFGAAFIVDLDVVDLIFYRLNLFSILGLIKMRKDRMAFERVMSVCMYACGQVEHGRPSLMGCIHDHPSNFDYTMNDYMTKSKPDQAIIKVWSGR